MAEQQTKEIIRVLTVKLRRMEFSSDEYKSLRDVAAQSARYANGIISSLMAEHYGYRPPEDKRNMSIYVRGRCKGDLSGAAYSAIEREVMAQWKQRRKLIWAGFERPPYYSADRAIAIRWDGVSVLPAGDDGFCLRARLLAADKCDPFLLPIRLEASEGFIQPRLEAFRDGEKILSCKIIFKGPDMYARLAFRSEIVVNPAGERHAAIEIDRDERLLLRLENRPADDLSHKLAELRNKKRDFEGIKARIIRRGFGRGKGDRRRRRKHLARLGTYEAWSTEYIHRMSSAILQQCEAAGCGYLTVMEIGDGTWPADKLKKMLSYKCVEYGIEMAEPEGEAAERTVKAKIRKKSKEAQDVKKAVETIKTTLENRI